MSALPLISSSSKTLCRQFHDGVATLRSSPFTCRKARSDAPSLRELINPFGRSGYVALFEIDDDETVTVLAIRHQLEEDNH
ncbi:type II toxin-antitoxin system RelE family toxin [Caballeronia choica]|uniref:type II toxin-antitoxin system RelE family toxin n=1 Tax=Caballeronia choica TaxID=326476 RepID=UPI0035B5607C